jgi:hypothetical protein
MAAVPDGTREQCFGGETSAGVGAGAAFPCEAAAWVTVVLCSCGCLLVCSGVQTFPWWAAMVCVGLAEFASQTLQNHWSCLVPSLSATSPKATKR